MVWIPNAKKLRDIRWEHLSPQTIIGAGGYGVVYAVAPDMVAKVGLIERDEVEAQRLMAAYAMALPVLSFVPHLGFPPNISRDLCGEHGYRTVSGGCSCEVRWHAVLLMPRLEIAYTAGYTPAQIEVWISGELEPLCERLLGRHWAIDEEAVMAYQGHLVAVDFGIP